MSAIKIQYASKELIPSYREALDCVAREKIYLEMIEAPPLESVMKFQTEHIARNGAIYYAVNGDKVVGWCDAFPFESLRFKHRASLGMGIIPEYRGQGIGTKLVHAVIDHCRKMGLEKIDLEVYTTNTAAVALYKKLGFVEEGLKRKNRKLEDGTYFDIHLMAKFL
jgi:ribosomal protein S18 acetylase RimI-like enzyme